MGTKLDLRQSIYRGSADQLSKVSPAEGDNLIAAINNQIKPLARLKANSTLVIDIESGDLTDSETDFRKHLGTIGSYLLSFSSGSVTLPALNNNNISVTPGSFTALLDIPTDGFYSAILVLIDKNAEVKVKVGAEASTPALALDNLPRPDIETFVVGAIIAQNVSGNIQNIDQDQVLQFNQVLTLNSSISDVASAASLDSSDLDSEVIQSPIVKVTGVTQGDIHGLQAGVNGQYLLLYNATNQTQTVRHQSLTESTPANRIICSGDEDIDIEPGNSSILFYDEADSRWRLSVQGGGSGGAAGIIYFKDTQAKNINKLDLYNDGASPEPVDGTGGVITTEVSKSLNTSTPLIGTTSYRFSKDANNRQGFGFSFTTDIPLDAPVKAGEPITVQFRYRTSANYAAGDVKMFVYLVGPNTVQALTGIRNDGAFTNDLGATGGAIGQFTGTCNADATTTAIRVIGHIASTSNLAYDIDVDEITIGTAVTLTSPIVTEWQTYTPSWTAATTNPSLGNGTLIGRWRRVGDTAEFSIDLIIGSTTTTGSGAWRFSIPTGLNTDTTKITVGNPGAIIGTALAFQGGTADDVGMPVTNDVVPNSIQIKRRGASDYFASNAPFTWANGNALRIFARVPIIEFRNATNIISSTQAQFQAGAFRASRNGINQTGVNPNGSAVKILFNSVSALTDFVRGGFSYDTTNSRFVSNKSMRVVVNSSVFINGLNVLAQRYFLLIRVNGSDRLYGTALFPQANTDTVLTISGQLSLQQNDFVEVFLSGAGNNSINTLTVNGSAAATYFTADEIPDLSVVGISGAPVERLEVAPTGFSAWTTTNDAYIDPAGYSLTLSPGVWRVGYDLVLELQNITDNNTATVGIFNTSNVRQGNSESLLFGETFTTAKTFASNVSRNIYITVTETTTYKIRLRSSLSDTAGRARIVGNADWTGGLSAPDNHSIFYAERIR